MKYYPVIVKVDGWVFLKMGKWGRNLGGETSNIFGIFTPILGEDSQFDEHIFQMGWNHQLVSQWLTGFELFGIPYFVGKTIAVQTLFFQVRKIPKEKIVEAGNSFLPKDVFWRKWSHLGNIET